MNKTMKYTSYKDPSGFVFIHNNNIYRQVNQIYKKHYDKLLNSKLYETLVNKELLISHVECQDVQLDCVTNDKYKIIKPEKLEYITYPYEWCFSQLKDAALHTLDVQKLALEHSMTLKDANAYNIQFKNGKPIFIDTLSFEEYEEGSPWIAYFQFCKHFLAPLALMAYKDISLNQLLKTNIDGIPLDLCCKLLPFKAKLNGGIFMHLILHNKFNKQNENNSNINIKNQKMSKIQLEALFDSLYSTVSALKFPKIKTEWGKYYTNTNYTETSQKQKFEVVEKYINKIINENNQIKKGCDFGANDGTFSRLLSKNNISTIALDIDTQAVEKNYLQIKEKKELGILPIIQDLLNPSPAIGFMNKERDDMNIRFKCDIGMALALIHHLAISNNLPFENIANFFSNLCQYLIIEFVPKTDSKVKILLATRNDIFENYNEANFELQFSKYFNIEQKTQIYQSDRILYLLKRK